MGFKIKWQVACVVSVTTLVTLSYNACTPAFQTMTVSQVEIQSFSQQEAIPDVLGSKLYESNCLSCHGDLENSTKRDRSLNQIKSAISIIPQMKHLSQLTDSQLGLISSMLSVTQEMKTCSTADDPGHTIVRRLNKAEYNFTIRDLLGINSNLSQSFPEDGISGLFFNNGQVLNVTNLHIQKYLETAEKLVDDVFLNSTLRSRLVTCNLTTAGCADSVVMNFARKAFRRPITQTEQDSLKLTIGLAAKEGDPIETGVKLAITQILISPNFIYRFEIHPTPSSTTAVATLNQYELASRLSYFIWSSTPDDALLAAAASNSLSTDDGIKTQILRMLKDVKADALISQFAEQWLQLHRLSSTQPSTQTYANFTDQIKNDMKMETDLFLKDLFKRDGSLFEILNARHTFLNENLARHYGISGITGTQFRRVDLNSQPDRKGLLTHGSLLTMTSNPDRTSIVKRGKFVLDSLLCAAPPPPPPEVVADIPDEGLGGTLRQRLEQHRSNPSCFGCHSTMDPIGFAFENYNGVGQWRTSDNNQPIDNVGEFPNGQKFQGSFELINVLQEDVKFKTCVARHLTTFALGREVREVDQCSINKIGLTGVSQDKNISDLVFTIVTNDLFRKHRGSSTQGVK